MTLYEQWSEKLENQGQAGEGESFFTRYLEQETGLYANLLGKKQFVLKGTLATLAQESEIDPVVFTGFLDGINTSLRTAVSLETLTEETELDLEILPEKLLYNMHVAKADWLYNLDEWKEVLDDETRRSIRMKYGQDSRATSEKIGRNDPCPCGSGKKHKKCCGSNA